MDIGKVSLLRPAYLWLHLFFRTSKGACGGKREREREGSNEKKELNGILKTSLKIVLRIKETALSFILRFLNKIWKMSGSPLP